MSNLNSKKIIHVMNVFSGSKLKIILNILKKYPVKLFQKNLTQKNVTCVT